MDDKINEILDLLRSQNEMIKDIHDYVKEVTSEKYIGEYRMTSFSINLAADILTEAISPKIKGMMVDLLRKCAANAGGWLPALTAVMSWCPENGTGSSRRRKLPKSS